MAGKIFINYRRTLNLTEAQLLRKVLQEHLGKSQIFLDVSGLKGGDHWFHALEREVDASAVMLLLISPGWADVTDERGNRCLDNPNDFVRFEIARAFSRQIPVLPLLFDGAEMPDITKLPLRLQPLSFQQAMLLRSLSIDDDGGKIARRVKYLVADVPSRGVARWAVGLVAIAALAAGIAVGPYVHRQLRPADPSDIFTDSKSLFAPQRSAPDPADIFSGTDSKPLSAPQRSAP